MLIMLRQTVAAVKHFGVSKKKQINSGCQIARDNFCGLPATFDEGKTLEKIFETRLSETADNVSFARSANQPTLCFADHAK